MLALGRPAARPRLPTQPHPRIPAPTTPSSSRSVRPRSFRAGGGARGCLCRARRRRVRYGDKEEEGAGEQQGHNSEIAMIECYSEGARGEALLVRATVDGEEETVLVFKGFSSLLSSGTSPDPARSVLPARAVITSVDVVRGPFDPSNIHYLEKGLSWEAFKTRIRPDDP